MLTKEEDENDKPEGEGDFQLSFIGSSSTERPPLLSRDDPNIVGNRPLIVHQFVRLMPQPQYATLVQVLDAQEIEPSQPMLMVGHKEIDDLTPPETSLAERLAAVTEVYGGKAIPISVSEEQLGFNPTRELEFSPVTPWENESFEDEELPNGPTFSHKGPSLQEDLKKEILYNAEILISFNSLYREAHADYILAREQYSNSKSNNDFMKLQRKETEINLMSKPIFMAEKMHKLLSDTLETLKKQGIDRGYETNPNLFKAKI